LKYRYIPEVRGRRRAFVAREGDLSITPTLFTPEYLIFEFANKLEVGDTIQFTDDDTALKMTGLPSVEKATRPELGCGFVVDTERNIKRYYTKRRGNVRNWEFMLTQGFYRIAVVELFFPIPTAIK